MTPLVKTTPTTTKNTSPEGIQQPSNQQHTWPKRTVLIDDDIMLHGIVENKLNGKLHVKVRPFLGALVADMEDYLKPLLKKKPTHLIMHIGTHDTTHSSSDSVVASILNLKELIKTNFKIAELFSHYQSDVSTTAKLTRLLQMSMKK